MPLRSVLLAGVALGLAAPLFAQAVSAPSVPRDGGPLIAPGDSIDFSADALSYDDSGEIATATGNVEMARDAYTLRADTVEYNRKTGIVIARGHVVSVDPQGNQAFGDRVELTESLKDGVIDNILLVLGDGGRLAAQSGRRVDGIATLDHAVYSPCAVRSR